MEQSLENRVPVAEQLSEINQVDEAIKTEYALNADGTIEPTQNCSEISENTQA